MSQLGNKHETEGGFESIKGNPVSWIHKDKLENNAYFSCERVFSTYKTHNVNNALKREITDIN